MRMRTLVLALVTIAVLIAAAACGYWVWWAGQLERGIAQWRAEETARGFEIGYGGPAIDGFPLAHVAHFENPAIQSPAGARWEGPALTARAPLWDPRRVAVSFGGRHVFERLNAGTLDTVVLDTRAAEGLLRLGKGGRLESAEAALEGLEVLATPFGQFAGDRLRFSLTPIYEAGAATPVAHAFDLEADALQVPAALAAPLDPKANKIAAAGRLDGVFPPVEPRLALAAWRDGGGALALDRLDIDWPPLALSASGRLVLDDRFRPAGELAARVAGLPALLDRLAAAGLMTPEQVATTKLAVLAFAGEPDAAGRPVLAVPVILRAGILYLGPLPLARLSPVL